MKTLITSIVTLLIAFSISISQPSLELVWKKNIFPTQIEFAKFSKDGNYIYCAIGNNIQVMDAKTGEFVSVFDNVDSSFIYIIDRMQVSNSGNFIVADNGNGAALVYDTRTERKIKQIQLGVSAVTISNDDRFLIFGSARPETIGIVVYDLMNDTIEKVINYQHNGINQIQISHNGRFFVTGSTVKNYNNTFNDQLILWDAVTLQQIGVLENNKVLDNNPGYKLLKFSADDKYLGAINQLYDGPDIYDLSSKKLIRTTDGRACVTFDFLPDFHNFIAFFDWGSTYALELYDNVFDNQPKEILKNYSQIIESNRMSNDSIYIFLYGDIETKLYKLNTVTSILSNQNSTLFKIIVENNKLIIEPKIDIATGTEINIYDLNGRRLIYKTYNNLNNGERKVVLDILPQGLIICEINIGKVQEIHKFEIVR